MLTHFVTSLDVIEAPARQRENQPTGMAGSRLRTEQGAKMAAYFEQSPRYTRNGALTAVRAALKKVQR